MKRSFLLLLCLTILPAVSQGQSDWRYVNHFETISNICFADSLRGWLLNSNPTDSTNTMFISKDGGLTWNSLPVPSAIIRLNNMHFTKKAGFCVGERGVILKSVDGGAHWVRKQSNSNADLRYLDFCDDTFGWSWGWSATSVVTTKDGGESWSEKKLPIEIQYIDFADAKTGTLVGSTGDIMKTIDGGDTWQTMPSSGAQYLRLVKHLTRDIIILGGNGVYRSSDGGQTWSLKLPGEQIQGAAFATPSTGWLYEPGYLLHTSDSGTTWIRQYTDAGTGLYSMMCIDSMNAWGYYQSMIFHTTNGGGSGIPYTPVPQSPANGAGDQPLSLTCSWSYSPVPSYQFQLAADSSFTKLITEKSGITLTQFTVNSLQKGTDYWWRVRAVNGNGPGNWSAVFHFGTATGILHAASPAIGEKNVRLQPYLAWGGSLQFVYYHLQVCIDSLFTSPMFVDVSTSTNPYKIGPLQYATNYYWRIADQVNGVDGPWSKTATFSVRSRNEVAFPLAIGTKWYYQYYRAPDVQFGDWAYGVIKEIVDTSSTGVRTVKVTRLYDGSTTESVEYLFADDGMLYLSTKPTIPAAGDYPLYNAENTTVYTAYQIMAYGMTFTPFPTTYFGRSITAQERRDGSGGLGASEVNIYQTTKEFGIIRWYSTSRMGTTITFNDSMFLAGMVMKGVVYGDTALANYSLRAPSLTFPANGQKDVPLTSFFTWNSIAGTTQYQLQVSTDASFQNIIVYDAALPAPTRSFAKLVDNQKYYWRVKGVAASGQSKWSDAWSFTTKLDSQFVPSLVWPEHNSANMPKALSFYWRPSGGQSYYMYFYRDSTISSKCAEWYTNDTTFLLGQNFVGTYYWGVMATTPGYRNYYSELRRFTFASNPAETPIKIAPANRVVNVGSTVHFSWTKAAGAVSYIVQFGTDPFFAKPFTQVRVTDTTATASGMAPGTRYLWRVQAVRADSSIAWSDMWNFLTEWVTMDVPSLSYPADGATNMPLSMIVNWKRSAAASSYTVQISEDPGFAHVVLDSKGITDTTLSVTTLAKQRKYYWRVQAVHVNGWVLGSETRSFETKNIVPPTAHALKPNYPNPFNSSTRITYDVAEKTNVTIVLYDRIGRLVRTLVNEEHEQGNYSISLRGEDLASGMYFVQARMGAYVEVKKIVLLR
ncbi:MAG TPA: YCF48-related protein [Bacteroidota bacterium]|nr:YCF48-related protein [Bacteroidota bacterium]